MRPFEFSPSRRTSRLSVEQGVVDRLSDVAEQLERAISALGSLPVPEQATVPTPACPIPPDLAYFEDFEVLLAMAKEAYQERRARDALLPPEFLGEPGWDILLDLLISRLSNKEISVTSCCVAACVPPTTALRWIDLLISQGFVERVSDPEDRRRSLLRLTEHGFRQMRSYFLSTPRGRKWAFRELDNSNSRLRRPG